MWVCPQDGWTALHLAAHEGKVDVVRLLTEAKAQVNLQTKVIVCVYIIYTQSCKHCLRMVDYINYNINLPCYAHFILAWKYSN